MSHPEDGRGVQQAPKYHGLINQGATCYLNSVLQVLFMTKDFREAVESSIDENSDTIDHHLRSLFSDLENKSTNTYNITKALDINTVYEQRDAAEYIEKILQQTSDRASQVFQGEWSHRTTCRKCDEETVRDEAFWHLPLALDSSSDGYRVMDGIKEFFKVSEFSGEDQMYCNKCNVKVDATAQYVMNRHPDVLILLLQRFEFDYQYMSYVKINCAVDVPSTIQLPKRQTYKLYAVVDHSGDLRGGHYTATIKDGDEDRWYNFNDSRVSLCDYQPFQVDNMESSTRSRTAQLLFYRKTEEAVNQDHMSNNQCEDAEKTRQRNDRKIDVETGDDRNVSGIVGLPEEPGHEGHVRQPGTHSNHEDNDERKDESDTDRERTLDANFKPEVSDQPKICDLSNQQEETNDAQSRVTDKDEMTGGKVSENPPMDYFNRDTEHLSEGGLDKQNRNKGQDSNLKTGEQFDPEHMDKQELKIKIKANIEGNTEKETGANAYPSVSVKHFTKHDSVCEQGRSSRLDKKPEQQEKEEREVEGGKSRDSGRLDEGIGQRNVKKQAEEKEEKGDSAQFHNREDSAQEGTVRRERENQNVESVQLSDKATGHAKTNKDKRIKSHIRRFSKKKKTRTGAAKETSNSSHDDQHPNSLIEHASSLMQTELAVPESKTRKIWRMKKQHGKEKEKEELKGKKKKSMKQKTPGCFSFVSRGRKRIEQSEEED